jgi:hypothetical protein
MTSNTTMSSCTVLPPSVVVPCAGDRVKAVIPPNRSVKFRRIAAYFSAPNGRPPLSLSGRNISIKCIAGATAEKALLSGGSQSTLVNALKINDIRAAAPFRGLHLFWEPFWRQSVSSGLDADGQT